MPYQPFRLVRGRFHLGQGRDARDAQRREQHRRLGLDRCLRQPRDVGHCGARPPDGDRQLAGLLLADVDAERPQRRDGRRPWGAARRHVADQPACKAVRTEEAERQRCGPDRAGKIDRPLRLEQAQRAQTVNHPAVVGNLWRRANLAQQVERRPPVGVDVDRVMVEDSRAAAQGAEHSGEREQQRIWPDLEAAAQRTAAQDRQRTLGGLCVGRRSHRTCGRWLW